MQSRHRQPRRPTKFTEHHEDLVLLYCIVHPERGLKDLFNNIDITGGEEAFPLDIRPYSNERRQAHRRRVTQRKARVFVKGDFYPYFEVSHIIDQLLASQSTPTKSTMVRGVSDNDSFAGRQSSRRSGHRRSDSGDDEDEELLDQFKNVSVGGSSRRKSSKSRSPIPPSGRRTGGTAKKGATTAAATAFGDDDDTDDES